jgi:hypothetical protein
MTPPSVAIVRAASPTCATIVPTRRPREHRDLLHPRRPARRARLHQPDPRRRAPPPARPPQPPHDGRELRLRPRSPTSQRLDLDRVLEIHLSGGATATPPGCPRGRTLRLDSHDDQRPRAGLAPVRHVLPRCPEPARRDRRAHGGHRRPGDELLLRDELRRARQPHPTAPPPRAVHPLSPPRPHLITPEARSPSPHPRAPPRPRPPRPRPARRPRHEPHAPPAIDPDGLRLAALLIARLRFERLQHGDRRRRRALRPRPRRLRRPLSPLPRRGPAALYRAAAIPAQDEDTVALSAR